MPNFEAIKSTPSTIESYIREHIRVVKLSTKPTQEEFLSIAKVAGLGIVAIGVLGFLIYITMVEAPKII